MAASSNFKFNEAFFEELGKSPAVYALVLDAARRVARRAISTAPRETGAYADGIIIRRKESRYRSVALVVATDSKSLIIEAKTGNLARALKAEGKANRGR